MASDNSSRRTGLEFKILIAGEDGVGKTSLIRRFIENRFQDSPDASLVGDYVTTSLDLFGAPLKLQIQDFKGEIWEEVASYYLQDNDGILLVLDTSQKTKAKPYIDYWLEPIKIEKPIIIVGNKSDLPIKMNLKKISQYIQHLGHNFIQTSAKTGENVSYAFKLLTSEIVKKKAAAKKRSEEKRDDGLSNIFTKYEM